jgi:hypothetical protein
MQYSSTISTGTAVMNEAYVANHAEHPSAVVNDMHPDNITVDDPTVDRVSASSDSEVEEQDSVSEVSVTSTTQSSTHSADARCQVSLSPEKPTDKKVTGYKKTYRKLGSLVVLILVGGTVGIIGFILATECAMVITLALERSRGLFPSMASASAGRAGGGAGKS